VEDKQGASFRGAGVLSKGTIRAMKKYSAGCIFLLHGGANLVFFECELTSPSARVRIAKEDESKN
jgi:hypothetical protein